MLKVIQRLAPNANKTKYLLRLYSSAKGEPQVNKSFMANIFRGKLESSQLFPYPDVMTADQKELTSSLIDPFEKFFLEVNNPALNDANCKIDEQTLETLWALGAFGIQVPNDLGGLGLNNTQYGRLCQIVGANDLALGIVIGAHQSIGFKGILLYGTPEQKAKYLPQVCNKVYAAFALTEPSAGSDANSIKCRAVKSDDGTHFILNGSKIWISNGGTANIMTVFAQTEMKDEKTGQKKDKVTAFIVEREFGGVTNGAPEKKMGIRASNTAEVYFEDVKIPIENVLGKEGEGFKVAMNILNNGRFGMGATMSGTMKHCISKAVDFANNRTQFGKKLKDYKGIQEKIARMSAIQYATESMAFSIAQNMDAGSQDYHLEAAISKIFGSEAAWYVCDEAIQIMGGMGFMAETGLERVLRDLRIFRIFEGTNDILRLFVVLTGIQYATPHLRQLQAAFKNPISNFGVVLNEVTSRVGSKYGKFATDLSSNVAPALQAEGKHAGECIDLFGWAVQDVLAKHGKNIVHEQMVLNRLAEAAIDIYAMVVTLSRATRAVEKSLPTTEHEVQLAKAWCYSANERVRTNLKQSTSPDKLNSFEVLSSVANTVLENGGVKTTHVIE